MTLHYSDNVLKEGSIPSKYKDGDAVLVRIKGWFSEYYVLGLIKVDANGKKRVLDDYNGSAKKALKKELS